MACALRTDSIRLRSRRLRHSLFTVHCSPLPARADRGLLRCPKFARRADDGFKFRPLPLLFARCIRHRRRSQTSPGRPVAKNHRPCGCCQGTRAAVSRPYGRLGKCVQKGGQSRPPLQWVRFFACRARRPGAPLWRFVRESAHLTCSLFTVHHSLFTERDVRVLSRAADSRPY